MSEKEEEKITDEKILTINGNITLGNSEILGNYKI